VAWSADVTHPTSGAATTSRASSGAGGSFAFGILDATNPVAKIDRSKIVFGCLFNGSGPYVMSRVPTFTLTPVRVTNKKGARLPVSRSAVHKLIADLR